jgi:hypothetical protein
MDLRLRWPVCVWTVYLNCAKDVHHLFVFIIQWLCVMMHNYNEAIYLGKTWVFFCLFVIFVRCLGFCDGLCVILLTLKSQIIICHWCFQGMLKNANFSRHILMQAKYFVLVELGCGQYCGALFYVLSLVEEMNVHDMWF